MRVLLVEDDLDLRETIALLLELEGWEVIQAEHGRTALDAVCGGRLPDVAVVDLMMPVMNGRSLCLALRGRRDTRSLPIIVMSGREDGETEVLGCSVAALLRKPVSIDQLIASIRDAVVGKHA